MTDSWDDIKEIIEKNENRRMAEFYSRLEVQEGHLEAGSWLSGRKNDSLKVLGALSMGLSAGIFAMIFNFLLFVWLLHIEF